MPAGRATQVWAFLALLAALAPVPASAAAMAGSLQVRADPDRLPADGRSQAVIVAEVLGPTGLPVPDGTPVRFLTTLGRIVSPVQTVGGLAQTTLTASQAAGMAVVSVVAGGARQILEIEFTARPGSAAPGSRTIELNADEISYSADKCLFVATWNARLETQRLSLHADSLQYEPNSNLVRAQGNVVLKSGGKEVRADALRYDLLSLRGRLIRLSPDSAERLVVEGDLLETRPDEAKDEALWELVKTDETRTWVKAHRAIIDPGNRIILDHATFYVDDVKALSLRRHVMAPTPGAAVFQDLLGFSSAGGVSLDYPYYYRASAHHIGTLSLRRNALATGSQWMPGWALGLTEEYTHEGRMEGSFSLDDVVHPRRGVHWQHQQQFSGGLTVDADASSLGFDENEPRYRAASLNVCRPVGEGNATLTLSKSDFGQSQEQFESLGYRLPSFRLPLDILGTPSFSLRHSSREIAMQDALVDPRTGEPIVFNMGSGNSTSAGFDLGFDIKSRPIGAMTLSGTLSTGYVWYLAGGSAQPTLSSRWTLDRRFQNQGRVALSYTYSATPAGTQPGLLDTGRQTLTLAASGKVKGATVGLSASRDLHGDREYGSCSLLAPLPFGSDSTGRPLWTLGASHLFSHFQAFRADSTQFALSRVFGRCEASLRYSPQGAGAFSADRPWISPYGVGYTYSGGRRLWLEFSAATH